MLRALAALGTALALAGPGAATAQSFGDGHTARPAGLNIVWQVHGRMLPAAVSVWSVVAFSPDGQLIAIGDEDGIRVRRADDGKLVDMFLPGTDPFIYSLAISPRGEIALGRVGSVELHRPGPRATREVFPYECGDDCSPVGAVAFSPDGELLAFQGRRSAPNRRRGLGSVNVVEVRTGALRAQLEASAARARVAFSTDGKRLFAASTTPFDDLESFGFRAWSSADWALERRLPGGSQSPRSEGAFVGAEFAAAYEHDGSLEVYDLGTGRMLWSAGLIAPALELEAERYTTRLERVEIAPSGEFVISYEKPVVDGRRATVGTIVIRRAIDGQVAAMYDVPDVVALAIAPDGKTFAYATGSGRTHTAVGRVGL